MDLLNTINVDQQAAHANRELNLEGLIKGHDVDAAALNRSTNPGSQSKQQINRVARAREAVDNMFRKWLVRQCVCFDIDCDRTSAFQAKYNLNRNLLIVQRKLPGN